MEQNALNFLRDSFHHHRELTNALDRKASFLLALASVIFGLSIINAGSIPFFVMAVCSLLSALLCVLVITSPFRGRIKGRFSLLCWWGFADKNYEQYKEGLDKVLASESAMVEEYKKEVWGLANYSLKPKTILLKWASYILLLGLLVGFILFFI